MVLSSHDVETFRARSWWLSLAVLMWVMLSVHRGAESVIFMTKFSLCDILLLSIQWKLPAHAHLMGASTFVMSETKNFRVFGTSDIQASLLARCVADSPMSSHVFNDSLASIIPRQTTCVVEAINQC
jgi:hypothetical protein